MGNFEKGRGAIDNADKNEAFANYLEKVYTKNEIAVNQMTK